MSEAKDAIMGLCGSIKELQAERDALRSDCERLRKELLKRDKHTIYCQFNPDGSLLCYCGNRAVLATKQEGMNPSCLNCHALLADREAARAEVVRLREALEAMLAWQDGKGNDDYCELQAKARAALA